MKLAILGSRSISSVHLNPYIRDNVTEIVSGGAKGVDSCAANYARKSQLKITVFLPDYARYGKGAPLKRNMQIAAYADEALIFWDGKSRGTAHALRCFQQLGKNYTLIQIPYKGTPGKTRGSPYAGD